MQILLEQDIPLATRGFATPGNNNCAGLQILLEQNVNRLWIKIPNRAKFFGLFSDQFLLALRGFATPAEIKKQG
jgi:hypothetical protein